MINSHVGPVHCLNNFPVNSAGDNTPFSPSLLCLFRRPFYVIHFAFLSPKSSINFSATSFATSFTGLPSNSIADNVGNPVELFYVLYLKVLCLTFGSRKKVKCHVSSVVTVTGSPCCNHSHHVSCSNCRKGCAAYAPCLFFCIFSDKPARSHMAYLAACAAFADRTGLQFFRPVKSRSLCCGLPPFNYLFCFCACSFYYFIHISSNN